MITEGKVFQLRDCENKSTYQFGKVVSLNPLKLSLVGGAIRRGYIFNNALVYVRYNGRVWSSPIEGS